MRPTRPAGPPGPLPSTEDLDNAHLFEIIDGRCVLMSPSSVYASIIASTLLGRLGIFLKEHPLGRGVAGVLFSLPLSDSRSRRPDGAFVSFDRWPLDRPIPIASDAWNVVPDLGVKVVSPNDLAEEILEKVSEYFRAGVELVWIVYPSQRLVHVYETFTRVHVRTDADDLDGGAVLPGFRVPVASLFPQAAPPAQ